MDKIEKDFAHNPILQELIPDIQVQQINELLRLAATNGRFELVQFLVENHNVDISAKDDDAIKSVTFMGFDEMVDYLLSAKEKKDLEFKTLKPKKIKKNKDII